MQSSRSPLYDLLNKEFNDNQAAKHITLETSLAKLKTNNVLRIFDEFSVLLNPHDLDEYAAQFSEMLRTFTYKETDIGLKLVSHDAQQIVQRWLTKIAARGCRDLIDKKQINLELAALLGWSEYIDKIDNFELLCAYVNAINLMIFEKLNKYIIEKEFIFKAISEYINQQYTRCVVNVLETMQIPYDLNHVQLKQEEQPIVEDIPKEHPDAQRTSTTGRDIAIGVGVGFVGMILSATAFGGILLFSRSNSSDSRTESYGNPDYSPPSSPDLHI